MVIFFFKIYFVIFYFIGASWRALFRTDRTIACANGVFCQDYALVSEKFFFFIDRCELRFHYNNNAIYNCLYRVDDQVVFLLFK